MATPKTFRIHVCPGVDARAAARDLSRDRAVGIDDIGENLYDVVRDEIFDRLGYAEDGVGWKTQRVSTDFGPVFVVRDPGYWTAAMVARGGKERALVGAREEPCGPEEGARRAEAALRRQSADREGRRRRARRRVVPIVVER
jgi:hypothetical protein